MAVDLQVLLTDTTGEKPDYILNKTNGLANVRPYGDHVTTGEYFGCEPKRVELTIINNNWVLANLVFGSHEYVENVSKYRATISNNGRTLFTGMLHMDTANYDYLNKQFTITAYDNLALFTIFKEEKRRYGYRQGGYEYTMFFGDVLGRIRTLMGYDPPARLDPITTNVIHKTDLQILDIDLIKLISEVSDPPDLPDDADPDTLLKVYRIWFSFIQPESLVMPPSLVAYVQVIQYAVLRLPEQLEAWGVVPKVYIWSKGIAKRWLLYNKISPMEVSSSDSGGIFRLNDFEESSGWTLETDESAEIYDIDVLNARMWLYNQPTARLIWDKFIDDVVQPDHVVMYDAETGEQVEFNFTEDEARFLEYDGCTYAMPDASTLNGALLYTIDGHNTSYTIPITVTGNVIPTAIYPKAGGYTFGGANDKGAYLETLRAATYLHDLHLHTTTDGTIVLGNKNAENGATLTIDIHDVLTMKRKRSIYDKPSKDLLSPLAGDNTVLGEVLTEYYRFAPRWQVELELADISKFDLHLSDNLVVFDGVGNNTYRIYELEPDYNENKWTVVAWEVL